MEVPLRNFLCLGTLTFHFWLISCTNGVANFTVVPPSVIYVSEGETARLEWDYSVDNRVEEFDASSPRWTFYSDNGSAFLIAQENVFSNWNWSINRNTCPARLLNPVRVSKESTATLVIHNVTLADIGTYGCVLVLGTRSPITSKVKLVVTSLPHISLTPSSSIIPINESQQLLIHCSATGIPTPNVTWHATQGDVRSQGVGNATINITYVTRNDSGMYNCCATNNLKKRPVCNSTLVSVQYKPEIDVLQSNSTLCSYNGGTIKLYCLARGVPSPLFTWYDPSNRSITTGSCDVTGGSVLELVTTSPDSYGLYRCKAENILGYDEHFINVSQKVVFTTKGITTSKSSVGVPTLDPAQGDSINKDTILLAVGGTVIFILVTTIAILTVMIFKKRSKNKVDLPKEKRNRQQEVEPDYAEVDKTKKKRPGQVIYAELDDLYLTGVNPLPPPLPNRPAYGEIDFNLNASNAGNV